MSYLDETKFMHYMNKKKNASKRLVAKEKIGQGTDFLIVFWIKS